MWDTDCAWPARRLRCVVVSRLACLLASGSSSLEDDKKREDVSVSQGKTQSQHTQMGKGNINRRQALGGWPCDGCSEWCVTRQLAVESRSKAKPGGLSPQGDQGSALLSNYLTTTKE